MRSNAISLFLCCLHIIAFSQDTNKVSSISIRTTFSQVPVVRISGIDTSYQNALSVAPAFKFRGKSGWGIKYSPHIMVSGSESKIYMHVVTAGYEKFGKNVNLAVSYLRFFFAKNTEIPYSPIKNELYFSLSYHNTWIQPMVSSSIGFGENSKTSGSPAYDVAVVAGISHDFGVERNGFVSYIGFTPSLMLNAGTNEYFSFLSSSKYVSNSLNYVKKDAKGQSSIPGLGIRNLELDLETVIEMGAFSVQPVAAFYLPITGSEKSLNGYWQVVLKYQF